MDIIKTAIDGVVIIEPRLFKDERGYFFESFSQKEFEEKVEKIVEQQAVERADSSNDYVFVNGKMIKRESNTTDSKTEK